VGPVNFKEIARRAETGPLTQANDFLLKRVSASVLKLEKEFDVRWDGKTLLNLDDELADRCWQAGKKLLLATGLFSMNSSRIIEFSALEVEEALRGAPVEVPMGQGKELKTAHHRGVEDRRPPFVFCGPFNADTSEEMFVKLNEAFAQEPLVDALFFPGYLKKLDGLVFRPTSALSSDEIPDGLLACPDLFELPTDRSANASSRTSKIKLEDCPKSSRDRPNWNKQLIEQNGQSSEKDRDCRAGHREHRLNTRDCRAHPLEVRPQE